MKVVFLERAVCCHLPPQPHAPFTTLGGALLQGLTANPEQCQGLPQPLITTLYSCVAPRQSQTWPIRCHSWQQEKNEDTTVSFHKITLISMETCSLYSEITCLFCFFLLLEQSNNNASFFYVYLSIYFCCFKSIYFELENNCFTILCCFCHTSVWASLWLRW